MKPDISAPAANASGPAPRSTTQRRSSSSDKASNASESASQPAAFSALRFSGRLIVTVAIPLSRSGQYHRHDTCSRLSMLRRRRLPAAGGIWRYAARTAMEGGVNELSERRGALLAEPDGLRWEIDAR